MTAPVRPTANPELGKLRAIMANYRAQGATAEEISELIAKYHPEHVSTPEMEAAREPLGIAGTVRGALANAGEGVGFSLADEAMGGLRGFIDKRITIPEGIDQVRDERDRFAQAHPKTALGLTLGGAVLPAVLTAGASVAGGAAPTVARVAGSGAVAGGVAGYGSGEGDLLSGERLGRGVLGAGLGYAAGKVLPHVLQTQTGLAGAEGQLTDDLLTRLQLPAATAGANATAGTVATPVMPSGARAAGARPPVAAPAMPTSAQGYGDPAFRAAGRAIGDPKKARTLLDVLEQQGMGDEALAMNAGTDQTVRAVRAAANQPGSTAGQTVNERLARQGGALGEAVPRDIGEVTGMGGVPGPVRLAQMQDELSAKVEGAYERFNARGDLYVPPPAPASSVPDIEFSAPGERFTASPPAGGHHGTPPDPKLASVLGGRDVGQNFQRYVDGVRALSPDMKSLPSTDARVIGAAFHVLQRDVRAAGRGVDNGVQERLLKDLRDRVLDGIEAFDPDFASVTRQYALDEDVGKVVQGAFDTGLGLPGKPVGTGTVELGRTTPAGQNAMRAGFATELQSRAGARGSNADLGDLAQFRDVARAVVGTPADRERFVEMFGRDKYQAMVDRLMPKIRAAAQNAAARGNSTTTKQLLDALAFGDDAMMDALGSLASGSPQGAVRKMAGAAFAPVDRAYRLGVGRTAGETADLLTTKGAPQIRSLLDYLEQMGQSDAARRTALAPVANVTARTAIGERP